MNRLVASLLALATLSAVHANPPAKPHLPKAPAPQSQAAKVDLHQLQEQQKRAMEQLRKLHEEARRRLEESWKRQLRDLEQQKHQHEHLEKLRQEWQRRREEAQRRQEREQREARRRLEDKYKHELAHPSWHEKPGQRPHEVGPGKPPPKLAPEGIYSWEVIID
jgi:TolA-binding protein